MDFMTEVETRLGELKADFIAIRQWEAFAPAGAPYQDRVRMLEAGYVRGVRALRQRVRANFAHFDAARMSSLMALPTMPLDAAELRLHRIWMGGPMPALALDAARQWQSAIDAAHQRANYSASLWVWNARQLRAEPGFIASPGPGCRLGICVAAGLHFEVHGLERLARERTPALVPLLEALHAQGRFVNLADFFRVLVLHEAGGIYLDVDTMPYRAATVFLARPEVPDYAIFAPAPRHLCWMNLVDDENGMLVAKRGTPALAALLAQMSARLLALRAPGARDLHDATYAAWREQLGHAFTSYHDLATGHSILHDDSAEAVVSGVRGMRLVVDAFTGAARPLDAGEQAAYEACAAALEQRGWRLPDPLALARVAELTSIAEIPRMAYAAQLRAQPASCHYYSFLSDDERLDRVNSLFGAYLLARNAQRIAAGGFWHATRGRAPALHGGAEHRAGAHWTTSC